MTQLLAEKPSLNHFKMPKPLRPLPKVAYERMRALLKPHRTLHFFLHNTYCRLVLAYKPLPYERFCSVPSGALRTKVCAKVNAEDKASLTQLMVMQ